jgi:hypothetical protein
VNDLKKIGALVLTMVILLAGFNHLTQFVFSPSARTNFSPQTLSTATNNGTPARLNAGIPITAPNLKQSYIASGSSSPAFKSYQTHPFEVVESNSVYAWTAEDGRSTNVIRQLAHNDLEYARMVAENNTIFRRQLVYHTEPFTVLAQQAIESQQSISRLTLPGLDGHALQVSVMKTDFESGGDRGLFYGKLPDDPNSIVTVAFIAGREAFTVISVQDQIYLQGEAREPGEIVVKSINPQSYGGTAD